MYKAKYRAGQHRSIRLFGFVFMLLLTLSFSAGCRGGGNSSSSSSEAEEQELEAARTLWASRSFQSYSYEIQYGCFCPFAAERIRVEVENNVVVSAVNIDRGETIANPGDLFTTIDGLFDRLQTDIDGDAYTAKFDPTLGYPVHAEVDPVNAFADDEYAFDVFSLAPATAGSCGAVQCPEGMECCNASCGICVPPGGACIEIFCEG